MRRAAAYALGFALVAVIAVLLVSGGGSQYTVRIRLADAAGLRQQSPVMIGGVQAGTVTIHLAPGDQVVADLKIDGSQAPVGRDASVAVAAVNFLGQKEAELTRGNAADPAPSGYTIPADHVTVSTDLDQVLDVLDASTRARLAILIDEAGMALTGRRQDLSQLLQQLPPTLTDANSLLNRLVSDNHTLGHLVTTSDQFVSQVDTQRSQLVGLINAAGQASVTAAARRSNLSATLARAPGTLAELQTFLAKLKATTVPLGPAAQDIAATAPYLTQTLNRVDPFVQAARPALNTATAVAPELTSLAKDATPVVRQANPVVATLATFTSSLVPISNILDHSVDNLLAVVDNWSRAIQFRDGLSHVFRGEAGMTADVLKSLIDRMTAGKSPSARRPAAKPAPTSHPAAPQAPPHPGPVHGGGQPGNVLSTVVNGVGTTVKGVGATVNHLLGQLLAGTGSQQSPPSSVSSLLGYLTGK